MCVCDVYIYIKLYIYNDVYIYMMYIIHIQNNV